MLETADVHTGGCTINTFHKGAIVSSRKNEDQQRTDTPPASFCTLDLLGFRSFSLPVHSAQRTSFRSTSAVATLVLSPVLPLPLSLPSSPPRPSGPSFCVFASTSSASFCCWLLPSCSASVVRTTCLRTSLVPRSTQRTDTALITTVRQTFAPPSKIYVSCRDVYAVRVIAYKVFMTLCGGGSGGRCRFPIVLLFFFK